MRVQTLVLSSLLLLAVGCSHTSSTLPSLPASHGHLSRALDRYLDTSDGGPRPEMADVGGSFFEGFREDPPLVVEPDQARGVFKEATGVLRGKPSMKELHQAAADIRASCEAGLEEACTFLREQIQRPKKLRGSPPSYTRKALWKQAFAVVVLRCWVSVDTKVRDCEVVERAPYGITEEVLKAAADWEYEPMKLAGHPIEVPYTFTMNFFVAATPLTDEMKLQWARARAAQFPHSSGAWARLAAELARQAPEDPWYDDALTYLLALSPGHWWAANELAWLHVQAGRHAEAAPLVRRARAQQPGNAYVLETSAAVLAASGQCEQALAEQRLAVEKLPAEWPAEERARFTRTLEKYQGQCAAPPPQG
jgi:hypothetical protein